MFRLDMVGHVDALWAGCNQAFGGWPCAVLWAVLRVLVVSWSCLCLGWAGGG